MIFFGHEVTAVAAWGGAKALIPRAWAAIRHRTKRIQELEGRVDALETALARCPGEACPACGQREFRAGEISSAPELSRGPGAHVSMPGFELRVRGYFGAARWREHQRLTPAGASL